MTTFGVDEDTDHETRPRGVINQRLDSVRIADAEVDRGIGKGLLRLRESRQPGFDYNDLPFGFSRNSSLSPGTRWSRRRRDPPSRGWCAYRIPPIRRAMMSGS